MTFSYFQELMQLRELSREPLVYQSASNPVGMGNVLPIEYGGCALGQALQAAFHSLPGANNDEKGNWAIYSANGM